MSSFLKTVVKIEKEGEKGVNVLQNQRTQTEQIKS